MENEGRIRCAALLLAAMTSPLAAGQLVHSGEIWCLDGVVDQADVAQVLRAVGTSCVAGSPECPEDLNLSGYVGASDLAIVTAHVGESCLRSDIDQDGVVDMDDVDAVLAADGRDCSADLDTDGVVTDLDLAHAEMAWGSAPDAHPGSARVRGDVCTLGVVDMLGIIEALGTACRVDRNKDGVVDGCDANLVCEDASDCQAPVAVCEPVEPADCPAP